MTTLIASAYGRFSPNANLLDGGFGYAHVNR